MIIFILNLTVIVKVKVLYMKKDKILPQPQKLYTCMPVMPVTNSRSSKNYSLWGQK